MTLHLNALPVHPQPLSLESYTGYLTRLAEANGIRHLNQLSVVTGLHISEARSPSDFPHVGTYARLPQIAACSLEHLQSTTFYYLLQKFGRTTSAPNMSKHFLQESIGSHLRYCPCCLEAHGFISLLWRFLGVEACPQHGVELLTDCGHCGQPMPFLSNGLCVSHCPNCQGDLRACQTRQATETAMQYTHIWCDDLAFLLTPQGWDECNVIQHVGPQLLRRRHQHQLSLEDVAAYIGVTANTIQGMESQVKARKGEHFIHYMRYSHWLGFSMRQLFTQAAAIYDEADVDRWIVLDIREQILLERLNLAVEKLNGCFPSFKWFAEQLGVSTGQLQQYAVIDARVKHLQSIYREREKERYGRLLSQAQEAARQLVADGQKVTRKTLSEASGVDVNWLRNRAEFAMLLQSYQPQLTELRRKQQQDTLYCEQLPKVLLQLQTLKPLVTVADIARAMDCPSPARLRAHPRVWMMISTFLNEQESIRVQSMRLKEDMYLEQIEVILHDLQRTDQVISAKLVCDLLGTTLPKLRSYYRVRARLEQLAEDTRRQNR